MRTLLPYLDTEIYFSSTSYTHLINLTVIVQLKAAPLSFEISNEAPVGHIWHHHSNAGASIETHPYQEHDVRMVKVLHLIHLTHHALNIRQRKQTCIIIGQTMT